jgi:hypothetical protein
MRAVEHGLKVFGHFSYSSILENIYVFSEDIIEDEFQKIKFDNFNEFREVKLINDILTVITDGDTISYFEIEYLKNTNVNHYELIGEKPVKENEHSIAIEKTVYKINDRYYASFISVLEDVIISGKPAKRKPLRTPLTIVNDILKEKNMSVILFISTDGAKITRAYQEVTELYDNEIVLFIEINDKSNYFGSVVRVKSGANINSIGIFPYKNISKLASIFKSDIDESSLNKILTKHIKNKDSKLVYIVKKSFLGLLDRVEVFIETFALQGASFVSKAIADGLGELKLKEERWKYFDEKGKPLEKSDLLLPGIDFFKKLRDTDTISEGLPTNNITGNAIETLKALKVRVILKINEQKRKEGSEFLFYGFFEKMIRRVLNVIDYFIEFLKNPLEKGVDLLEIGFVAYNAFLVGIINGLIDAVKGIFELIVLISNAQIKLEEELKDYNNIFTYVILFIEALENQVEIIINLFSRENLKALFSFFKECIPLLINLPSILLNAASDVTFSIDEVAYYYGYIVGMIIQIIVETIATGGAATVEHAIESLVNNIKGFFKLAGKGISKSAKLIDTIIDFLYSLKQQAKNLKPFLDEILEWLRKLLKSDKVDDLFSKRKGIIDDIENGKIKLDEDALGNKRKKGDQTRVSNYSEMKVDNYFETQTFKIGKNVGTLKRISTKSVSSLDDKITKGIDGIYEFSTPPPKYIISEVKYNTAKLSTEITKSGGSQMSEFWIETDLLKGSVLPEIADDILIQGYEPLLCNVSKSGKVTIKTIKQTLTSASESSTWTGKILK